MFIKEKIGLLYPKLDSKVWSKLYSDPFKIKIFSSWLKLILSVGKHDIGEKYNTSKMASFAGFLTYRYIKLYTYGGKKYAKKIGSLFELIKINKSRNFIDIIIKTENLHRNILDIPEIIKQKNN